MGALAVVSFVGACALSFVIAYVAIRPLLKARRPLYLRRMIKKFAWQREQLEAKFGDLAAESTSGSEQWERIDFNAPVSFVRDRMSGRLSALLEVEIRRYPDIHVLPSSTDPKVQILHATAVFFVQKGRWTTKGRLLADMSPGEALFRFPDRYEALPQPTV